jgi:hypothetical protein
MARQAILSAALLSSLAFSLTMFTSTTARAEDAAARTMAQEILDKGSALFDRKDAAEMAATWTEDGQILWYERDKESDELKVNSKTGRGEIESLYRSVFKDQNPSVSKNNVDHARLVSPDLLVIEGTFQPNVESPGRFPFVQVRVKQNDKWLLKTLQLFLISQD